MIEKLLKQVISTLQVETTIDKASFETVTITRLNGKAVNETRIDMTPMYEVFRDRLMAEWRSKDD